MTIYALILIWAVAGNIQGTTVLAEYSDQDECQDSGLEYAAIEGRNLSKKYLTWLITCEEQRRS